MLSTHRIFLLHHLATVFAPELGLWGQPTPLACQKADYRIHWEHNRLGQEIGRQEGRGDRLQMDHLVQYSAPVASVPPRRAKPPDQTESTSPAPL